MEKESLSIIDERCDVEVSAGKYTRGSFSVKVKGLSKWDTTIRSNDDMLAKLIALREAGYKVPEFLTRKIAEIIVNDAFNRGDLL